MIRVYVVEDSPTCLRVLLSILQEAPGIQVVGQAEDGRKAMQELPRLRPDVLLTDLFMPHMDGFALIDWVMAHQPTPILVLSDAVDSRQQAAVLRCLEAGAVDVHSKPKAGTPHAAERERLLGLIRLVSQIKPVRRWNASRPAPVSSQGGKRPALLAIGASTGGPQALRSLLKALPKTLPLPILIAQHIEPGFMEGFGTWLSSECGWPLRMAKTALQPEPGVLILPPGGYHLLVDPTGWIRPLPAEKGELPVPSIDRLFQSVVRCHGAQSCGILLSGMGKDGAKGLKEIRDAGGRTFAQDEASCIVFGMPAAAQALGAVTSLQDPEQIAAQLSAWLGNGSS